MSHGRLFLLLACAALAPFAAGCNGSDGSSSAPPPRVNPPETQSGPPSGGAANPFPSGGAPGEGAGDAAWPGASGEVGAAAPPDAAPETSGGAPGSPGETEVLPAPTRTLRSADAPPRIAPVRDDHVVRVFYATDRAPVEEVAGSPIPRGHYLPTAAAGVATLLAVVGLVLLPRKVLCATLAGGCLAATIYLGQFASVRAQQLRRAAEFGDRSYGSARHERDGSPTLELGVCEVSVPPDHRVGKVESPSVLRFEFREDPERHVVLQRVVRVEDDAFYGDLRETVAASKEGQAFVFVHGYNVGFDSAVKRTAQIAYDLKFDGAAVCYSWPSRAGLASYTHDEADVAWTVTQLDGFLRDLAERSGARTIHLVAHSMGNRALVQALERIALRGGGPTFGQVILAAPDVDAGEFRNRYAPALAAVARRVTLYASSNDRALIASTRVHGYNRAGLSGEHLVVVPGLETVDVSPIDTSLIGHSYYGDNPTLLRDLEAVIALNLPAERRMWLERTLRGPSAFWTFRQDVPAFPSFR